MRGVERRDRDLAIQRLKNGEAPVIISREMDIPLSTVTTWLKILRKDEGINIPSSCERVKRILYARVANTAEAKIMQIIGPYLSRNISDEEWLQLEKNLTEEIKNLIDRCC